MKASYKIFLLYQFIVISGFICASTSIDNNAESDPRMFFYFKDIPDVSTVNIQYSTLNLDKSYTIVNNQSNVVALEYYAKEKTLFWATSKGELYSTFWDEDKDVEIWNDNRDKDPDDDKDEDPNDDKNDKISSYKVIRPKNDSIKLLYTENNWYPRSMALDEVGKKIYIADSFERTIDVFDLNGKNKARIFASDDLIPYEIAIDSSEGLLFLHGINFLQRKTELHRMNMDGSDHRLIIDTVTTLTEPILRLSTNFAIDRENKRLYYKPSLKKISMTDYEGQGDNSVLKNKQISYFDIYKNHLYWTKRHMTEGNFIDFERFMIETVFLRSTYPIFSCNVRNRIKSNSTFKCTPIVESKYISKDYISSFKIFDFVPAKKIANPCLSTNNGCEDHCLLKSSGLDKKLTFGCACRLDRKLNQDQKTCSDIKEETVNEESVPYIYEKVFMLYSKPFDDDTDETKTYEDSLYKISTNFAEKLLSDPGVVSDDALQEKFEVNNNRGFYKSHNDRNVVLLKNSAKNMSKVITYDWVSKNLYYAILCDNSTDKYNLFVMATKNPEKGKFLGQIDLPTAMAVHPYRGYLFIATYDENKNESHIIRFNTDGKEKLVFPYTNNSNILLTLDMTEDKVYWIDGFSDEEESQCVRSSNLDGSDAKLMMDISLSNKATKISVYGDRIYINTSVEKKNRPRVYVFNKNGEEYANFKLKILKSIMSNVVATKQKVKKTDAQYLSAKNPCVINNGGCDLFCFAVPTNSSQTLQKVCSS